MKANRRVVDDEAFCAYRMNHDIAFYLAILPTIHNYRYLLTTVPMYVLGS